MPYGSAVADLLLEYARGPGGLELRRWRRDDAETLAQAIAESREHLRLWMPWIAHEPLSLEQRSALIDDWEREWQDGGDVLLGVFLDGSVAGGCGLHHRIGPGGLEIGYWTHPSFLRRGIATSAARLLTNAAFARAEITHVEIHHDKANEASLGIPQKLGFRLVREVPDEVEAPAEVGIACEWQLTREDWNRLRTKPGAGDGCHLVSER